MGNEKGTNLKAAATWDGVEKAVSEVDEPSEKNRAMKVTVWLALNSRSSGKKRHRKYTRARVFMVVKNTRIKTLEDCRGETGKKSKLHN